MNQFQGEVLYVPSRIGTQEVLESWSKNRPAEHLAPKQHFQKLLSMSKVEQVGAAQKKGTT